MHEIVHILLLFAPDVPPDGRDLNRYLPGSGLPDPKNTDRLRGALALLGSYPPADVPGESGAQAAINVQPIRLEEGPNRLLERRLVVERILAKLVGSATRGRGS